VRIAVSLERVAWRQLRPTLRGMRKFALAGRRPAYCGGDRSSYELVKLSSTEVLHIVGPCLIASKFADFALTRVPAS
jgi:hypothetical protein